MDMMEPVNEAQLVEQAGSFRNGFGNDERIQAWSFSQRFNMIRSGPA
jgi:hypothetical protein